MIGKLLFVDNDESSRRLVETALTGEGVTVNVAGNAAAVLEHLGTDRYDLVLVGVPQASGDGVGLIDQIKAEDPTVPIVALAAAGENKTGVRAIRSGAAHYLTKPIDQEELVAVVRRALETRAMLTELSKLRQQVAEMGTMAAASSGHGNGGGETPVPGQSLRATAEGAARNAERHAIMLALQVSHGNKSQAAKALKTDYKTLHVKMKALKIHAQDFKVH